VYIPLFIGCALCSFLSRLGYMRAAQVAISWSFLIPGLFELVTAVCLVTSTSILTGAADSFYWWLHSAIYIISGLTILFWDEYLYVLPPMHFVVNMVALNIQYIYILDGEPFQIAGGSSVFFLFWWVFVIFRQVVLIRSTRIIEPDKRNYELIWREILESPAQVRAIADLEAAVISLYNSSAVSSSTHKVKFNHHGIFPNRRPMHYMPPYEVFHHVYQSLL